MPIPASASSRRAQSSFRSTPRAARARSPRKFVSSSCALWLASLAGVLGGCASSGPPSVVVPAAAVDTTAIQAGPAITVLRDVGLSNETVNLHARLLSMLDARRVDTLLIDEALAYTSPHIRAAAAMSIGQAGAQSRSGRLAVLLEDADFDVAANAAFSLGLLRDSTAIGPLASALRSGRGVIALEAAWALGEIGAPARAAIEGALADAAGVRHLPELLRAAAKLRPVPVHLIAPHLAAADSIRAAAIYALSRSRPPGAVRHLLGFAGDSAWIPQGSESEQEIAPAVDILASVARGLAAPAAGDSLRDGALAALRRLVRHPHPHVRINAVRSLGTFGPSARDAVMPLATDTNANVRIAVAQSVATVLDSAAADWDRLWSADTGLAFRAGVLASAAQGGDARHVLRLGGPWAAAGDWRHRSAYAGALASSRRGPRRDRALEESRASLNPRVRAATLD